MALTKRMMAMIRDPKAAVPKWNTVVLNMLRVRVQNGTSDLFQVQYLKKLKELLISG